MNSRTKLIEDNESNACDSTCVCVFIHRLQATNIFMIIELRSDNLYFNICFILYFKSKTMDLKSNMSNPNSIINR